MSFLPRKRIQPKLRSMPLRKTPSAVYIQMHQLANEKERLQQELRVLCDRHQQILQRLQELDQGLIALEASATEYALQVDIPELNTQPSNGVSQITARAASSTKKSQTKSSNTASGQAYESMLIEY